jgi:hypothetical protein
MRNQQGGPRPLPILCFSLSHPTRLFTHDLTFAFDCGMIDGNRPAAREKSIARVSSNPY